MSALMVVAEDLKDIPLGAIKKVYGKQKYFRLCDRCGIEYQVHLPSKYLYRGKEMPTECRDCRPNLCPQGHDKDVVGAHANGKCVECQRVYNFKRRKRNR